jgi:Short-chain dehydrogenases of various substrate specificities
MDTRYLSERFSLQHQTAVITGGAGVLGRALSVALARAGARVVVISRHAESANKVAAEISLEGGQALGLACDVTDRIALDAAYQHITQTFGAIDILINGAGGNQPGATTSREQSFFELEMPALDSVYQLNFTGTILSSQVFGKSMVEQGRGCIVNISSKETHA